MTSPAIPQAAARPPKIMKYTAWDLVPVGLGVLHFLYLVGIFIAFPHMPLALKIVAGLLYAISISWSINSVSHNFIHNPFFRSWTLNTAFSYLLSLTIGFSQAMYNFIHMRHHSGNMDRPDEHGKTIDYISMYQKGKDGKPENIWRYTFLSFFRIDPDDIFRDMGEKRRDEVRLAKRELVAFVGFFVLLGFLNWHFIVWLLPFWYLGHSLSSLNGYYEHFGGNPDKPIAWGVSTYDKLYNWTWLNNGYHAEHHYRPKQHWTKMAELHDRIREEQEREGVRVIRPPHPLGFLDPNLPHAESRG